VPAVAVAGGAADEGDVKGVGFWIGGLGHTQG
jgi:hypothetical protein